MPIAEPALAGLGWVASPSVISKLVTDSISYLRSDIGAKELEDLETTVLTQIQLTIEAAEHSTPNKKARLAKWLARLRNAYFDAEAILHELEYERLKRKAKGDDKKLLVRLSSKPIIRPLVKFFKKNSPLLSLQKRMLWQRLNKLKEVAAEAKTFRDLLCIQDTGSIHNAGNNTFVTTSPLSNADKVFGRDGDREEIIKFLLNEQGGSSSRKSYSVVAVTGMGGAGKTTLAQYIYNDPRVKKHFPVRIWLCLSRNLNIIECTKNMIECVSGKECPDLQNLVALQNRLIKTIPESDKIMVVLDDVWYDREAGENQWDDLLKPFAFRQGTCKIVVTSRSSWSFPNALQPGKPIDLSDLALDDFISLLRYYAIDGLQINNPQLKDDLSDIVNQIAIKMSKLPLAAKVVGNQLRGQPDIWFWRYTLENVNLSDIMDILLWSFYRFDVQLQRCFLFCSTFPKGTRFDLDSLVPYWVALDFIKTSDYDNREVEDIGWECFRKMVANYIFHPVDKTHKWYIIHNLFHDLAEKLSVEYCFRVANAEIAIPSTVQHVYLKGNNENLNDNLSSIYKLSKLRTLILENPFIDDISEIIPKISANFRNLRVLDVKSRGYKTLPRVVGDLRNLRFLSVWQSSIEDLPDSILQLYHLQFLYLPSSIKTLPTNFSNLIKLRYIKMYNRYGRQVCTLPPVPYLSKLTSLQDLPEFHVRKEEGYELHQLGCFKEIGGFLRIVNLENVRDKDEARKAGLIDKLKLKRLELVWDESAKIDGLEIEVIEALQPPANLEWLRIDGYRGSTYPTWLVQGFSELVLQNLGALRGLPTFPENLARLSIIKCSCLIFVCENELQVNENQKSFEQFLKFGVEGCKNILDYEIKSFEQTGSKENCAEQLKIMESVTQGHASKLRVNVNTAWWHCHQQRMNFIFSARANKIKLKLPSMLRVVHLGYCCVSDGALSDCLTGMVILEELSLEGIMTITTFPPAQVLKSLHSLRVLEIRHCWYLSSLGGLHALPHLERCLVLGYTLLAPTLQFKRCPPLPATLQSFIVNNCCIQYRQ